MASRLSYVRYLQSNFFGSLNAGDKYRAIVGVITFFDRNNLGASESWVSYVDASIAEGIQSGGAITLSTSTNTEATVVPINVQTFSRARGMGCLVNGV